MDKVRWLVNVVLLLILLDLVILGYFYFMGNPFEGPKQFKLKNSAQPYVPLNLNLSNEVKQFYPNLRFNHNEISFYIEPGCSEGKRIRMLQAFLLVSNATQVLSFYPSSDTNADIIVDCTNGAVKNDDNSFVAGEGGPAKIINSTVYPIIIQGKILLHNESSCKEPVTEMHELLHVLGFEHINDPNKILYPYLGCEQTLDYRVVEMIKQIYSLDALPEIYFKEAIASKSGNYLSFNIQINNQGIGDAQEVVLRVYEDEVNEDNEVGSFNLNVIEMGEGKSLEVTNLKLPSRASKKIIFTVESENTEYNLENNQISIVI